MTASQDIPIILQLQRDALDKTTSAGDLLRKALLVARKLRLTDFEKWANDELNGYSEGSTIPPYRQVMGEVVVHNPYRGWQPVIFENSAHAELCTKRAVWQPVAEIEAWARSEPNSSVLQLRFPPDVELMLMKSLPFKLQPVFQASGASTHAILDAIRNAILNWAISVEQDGILGEGISFSAKDRTHAAENATSYNITNFFGSVSRAQVTHGEHALASMDVSPGMNIAEVVQLIEKIKDSIGEKSLDGDKRDELNAEIKTVEAQAASPRPKQSVIKDSLWTIRSILEGLASDLVVQMIIVELSKVIS